MENKKSEPRELRALGRDYTFLRADASFAPELAACELSCFPEDPWSPEMFTEALENPSCTVMLLKDIQMPNIIAYCVIYSAGGEADLANIAVMPEYRRQGLGRLVIEKMLDFSRDNGVSRMFLEVRESNNPARELYRSSGFVEIGKRRKYYRNPREDAIIMLAQTECQILGD